MDIENQNQELRDDCTAERFSSPAGVSPFPYGVSQPSQIKPPTIIENVITTEMINQDEPKTPDRPMIVYDENDSQLRPSFDSKVTPMASVSRSSSRNIKEATSNDEIDHGNVISQTANPFKPVTATGSLRHALLHPNDPSPKSVTSDAMLFEEKVAYLTHSSQQTGKILTKNQSFFTETAKDLTPEINATELISNSLDEVVSRIYDDNSREQEQLDDADEESNNTPPELEYEKENFISTVQRRRKAFKFLGATAVLIVLLAAGLIFKSFPLFTCHHREGLCLPQLTVQLTDKSLAAKTALITVKEALKVLTYLAIDFGDSTSELDTLNSGFDTYYQDLVIDTFSVKTLYQLNFLGYCRLSAKKNFCMKSYGLDLLSVFVRDAGVQLGELTRTNVNIMGDSFAIAYELAISGFNQFTNKEDHSVEYIDYAILLQKFSKGLGFLTVSQFVVESILLFTALLLMDLKCKFVLRRLNKYKCYFIKKWVLVSMISLSFINLFTSFLICSLTFEYILKLSEVGQRAGIANVNRASGFTLIWISFTFQIFSCCLIIYLANGFRKGLF